METTKEFATKLTEIADLAFSYGISKIPENQKKIQGSEWTRLQVDYFVGKCHEGYKLAQKRLITEIMTYQQLLQENKQTIKIARSGHDKMKTKQHIDQEKVINRRLHNLSHIADGIAIAMLGHQVHVARRLHIGDKSNKHLEHSNISHAIKIADKLNEDPGTFALISDLTGFIQIGDLLVLDRSQGLYISELKEGEVNQKIREFIDQGLESGGVPCHNFQSDFTKTEIDQMKRMLRQDLRAAQAVEVINTDQGTDSATGANISVNTPEIDPEYYDLIFLDMLPDLNNQNWSYRMLDSCLHIGMYEGDGGMIMAATAIPFLIKTYTENYLVVDLINITERLSETLFSKSLPKDFVVKIMTGQAKIMIGIDLDKLIEVFNINGLETRWLSKKETARMKSLGKNMEIVSVKSRAIGIKLKPDLEGVMSWGIINKIVFDNILPSSLATSIAFSSGPGFDEKPLNHN